MHAFILQLLREHHFPCKGLNYDWNVLKCVSDDPSRCFKGFGHGRAVLNLELEFRYNIFYKTADRFAGLVFIILIDIP